MRTGESIICRISGNIRIPFKTNESEMISSPSLDSNFVIADFKLQKYSFIWRDLL
jgi:hypothetical protein